MDKYEISIWEDYSDGSAYLKERKLAIIGSDSMREHNVLSRALEPNLVEEINGTHTFTFNMLMSYIDIQTGEQIQNPYIGYLINERKVKVYWKNKWYDLVIKKCQEDSSKKSITYTCTDLFINELSKNGYSLEFDTELQNNIGTAQELAEKVLDGTTWSYDSTHSEQLVEKSEGAVYEIYTSTAFNAQCQRITGDTSATIPANSLILVFYDSITKYLNLSSSESQTGNIQFVYSSNTYTTDVNEMLVTNGDCYNVTAVVTKSNNTLTFKVNSTTIFTINLNDGISLRYRANRLVQSRIQEYDKLLGRYVYLCEDSSHNLVYEVETTEYSDPVAIINLVANPSQFSNIAGWNSTTTPIFQIYPTFGSSTVLESYTTKSYLRVTATDIYNSGIYANVSYFQPSEADVNQGVVGGIQKGEKYVFRYKGRTNSNNAPTGNPLTISNSSITPNLYKYTIDSTTKVQTKTNNTSIFTVGSAVSGIDNWIERILTCNTTISAKEIQDYGLFLTPSDTYWLEEVQFFKYAEGLTDYSSTIPQRMNPGEITLQGIVTPVHKYYYKNNTFKTPEEVKFLYVGKEASSAYTPVYNNYERIGTIQEKESNRFNILQTIAETFQAWACFRIDHNDDGSIKYINNIPQKFVYFTAEVGQETGISFEYGIDLNTITRTINSDQLATKVIVIPNANEFAQNGFCTIARSSSNTTKENFILNLDYYIQQGLIDKETLSRDLYTEANNSIGYYPKLYQYNSRYDEITEQLSQKQLDLIKEESDLKTNNEYVVSATTELADIKSQICILASVSTFKEAQTYARSHTDFEELQALLNAYGQTQIKITETQAKVNALNTSISSLKAQITSWENEQSTLLTNINNLHKLFNDKYGAYIQEGTWQDESYIDDTKYYLDALQVAYTSSRPQITYSINVMRLTALEEFSSKVFNLGDICYMQDREFFGYLADGITPYKEQILISEISSFFDAPDKDNLTVQNYKTQFDDLFQRITAATQSLKYAEGKYARVTSVVTEDGVIDFATLQETFDKNASLVLNSSNQDVVWDDTGITIKNKYNSADQTRIIAGGLFVTNDGGQTWKNAVRGDGISTDLLTAGRINVGEIYLYNKNTPYFRWDKNGITAYDTSSGSANFNKFVRHDQFGIYGYDGTSGFVPTTEASIWNNSNAKFGMTWKGFFLRGSGTGGSINITSDSSGASFNLLSGSSSSGVEISTTSGIVIKNNGNTVFTANASGLTISGGSTGGWTTSSNSITRPGIGLYANGSNATINGIQDNYYINAGNNFGVTSSGRVVASNATITGNITAVGGSTGGWGTTSNSIKSSTVGLYANGSNTTINGIQDNYYIIAGSNFGVTSSGRVVASYGDIGGWAVNNTSLTKGSGTTLIGLYSTPISGTINGTSGSYYIKAGNNFGVKNDGTLVASNAIISGTINATSGQIAQLKLKDNSLIAFSTGTYRAARGRNYNVQCALSLGYLGLQLTYRFQHDTDAPAWRAYNYGWPVDTFTPFWPNASDMPSGWSWPSSDPFGSIEFTGNNYSLATFVEGEVKPPV